MSKAMLKDLGLNNFCRIFLLSCVVFVTACASDDARLGVLSVDTSDMEIVRANPDEAEMFQEVQPQSIGNPALEPVPALNGRLLPTIFATETDIDPAFAQSSVALVEQLNDSLLLPVDVAVSFADCGTANAFFAPAQFNRPAEIVMCHELTALLSQFYDNNRQAFLASTFVLMHEVGHALIDVLELPVLGIEESYVDGIAAVLMGESGIAEGSVLAGWFFGGQTNTPFFDTHRAGPQRLGDLACLGGWCRFFFRGRSLNCHHCSTADSNRQKLPG